MNARKGFSVMLAIAVALLTVVSISTPVVADELTYQCGGPSTECEVVRGELIEQGFTEPAQADFWLEVYYPNYWYCWWNNYDCLLWWY